MKKKLVMMLVSSLSLVLSGCSTFYGEEGLIRDPDMEYHREVAPPPLVLPKNMQTAQIGDDYEVPDIHASTQTKKPSNLIPPGSLAEQVVEGKVTPKELKKQRQLKEASLIVVDTDMNETWDKLSYVLPKLDYEIAVANSDRRIYYILDKTATRGRVTLDTPIYEIHLQMSPAGETEIFATDTSDKSLPLDVSRPMLAEINKGLHGKVKTPWLRMISELI